jgi:broad specificity phosphatase PhoE
VDVIIEADGASRGNPGPASYGALVLDARTGAVLAERAAALGVATNNVAEYRGLIAGLQAAQEVGAQRVTVRMDSKLVIEQAKGTWKINNTRLRELHEQARAVARTFAEIGFEWVPRAQNSRADRLANEALDRPAGQAEPPAPEWLPPTGAATRFVLVRHGATEHSPTQRFSGRNELPLAETGRAQAAALAARDFGEVTAVVSSPLRRAVETAEPIAAAHGLAVEIDDGLVETDFGRWEGLTFGEATDRDPELMAHWLNAPDAAPPGGESFVTVGERVRDAQQRISAAHPGGRLVVVSHVTPIKLLLRMALDAPPQAMFRIHLDTASVSIVDYLANGGCSVRLVNDTSHLSIIAG